MYKWVQIRIMREKSKGIKSIGRALGVSKNTVRKYLRLPDPPEFKAREYEKKVDNFREPIQAMLKQEYIGTRIYEELLGMGYQGSLSGVHRYLHECKQEENECERFGWDTNLGIGASYRRNSPNIEIRKEIQKAPFSDRPFKR
ncbi:MAG: hypothetical protein ABSB22_06700 [Thermodesulfobacteriota bacterium]